MNQAGPPPTVFEFAPDVPEGVEVYADPNCVRITVASPNGREQRFPVIMNSVPPVAFLCCWTGGLMCAIFLSRPLWQKVIPILIIWTPIIGLWRLILKKHLRTPTVLSIRDTKFFHISGPTAATTWPLYEHSRLKLEANRIDCSTRRGSSYLQGYPLATREWVVREFKRAGQWAYDWLTYRVTAAAAAQRANAEPQDIAPSAKPLATPIAEPPHRTPLLGFGPKVLDYPIPPPRGNLRYETIRDGVAIIAPAEKLWTCGIVFRVILALLYTAFVCWFRTPWLRIGFALIGAIVVMRSIRKLNWRRKQQAVLAVLPGEFMLEDLGNQRQRRTMAYDKVRALTAFLYRPDYNYISIETIEGDLWFGHRCNEDEIRWLGQFILARVGIPQEQMKINRGEIPERVGNTGWIR